MFRKISLLLLLGNFHLFCQSYKIDYVNNLKFDDSQTTLSTPLQKGTSFRCALKISPNKKSSYTLSDELAIKIEDVRQIIMLAQVFKTTPEELGDVYMKRESFTHYYKDIPEKIKYIHYRIDDRKEVLLKDQLNTIEWKKIDSIKTILDYKCKLAKATIDDNEVYAWYTTRIAIPEGPEDYWGCPGLILHLETSKNTISAEKISRFEDTSFNLKIPDSIQKVNKEEFLDLKFRNKSNDNSYRLDRVMKK